MLKKLLAGLLMFALLFTTACGSGDKDTQTAASGEQSTVESSQTGTDEKSEEIVQLTAWVPNKSLSGMTSLNQMDTKIGKLIAKETGVAFNETFITGDAEQALNLKLASKSWEDVISTSLNFAWVEKLVKADVIVPLDSYFTQPDKYPNLAKISPKVLDNFRYTDGHIYYFPSFWYEEEQSIYGYWCASGWYVHPDYLKAVGMTAEDLSTTDGVEKFLLAVKQQNLKTGNLSVLPMSSGENASMVNTIFNTFGVSTANFGFDEYDGKLIHFRDHPQTKAALGWLNKLYNEGLIDKEISTQKNDQYTEKLMNRRVALVADQAWPFWSAVTAGKTPATELQYIKFPSAPGVNKLGINFTYNPYGNQGIMVTKSCKNPDAIAKLADWGSVTGVERAWEAIYGPRGTTWDFDPEKGKPWFKITDTELNDVQKSGDYAKLDALGYANIVTVYPFADDLNYWNPALEDTLAWIFGMHKFNAQQGYHTIVRPMDTIKMPGEGLWNKNVGTLQKLDVEYFTKLITAPAEKFEDVWNQYRDQLEVQCKWTDVKAEYENTYKSIAK